MKNPVIALGLSTPGIFIMRHFRKFGIETYGLDSDSNELGFKSKFGIKNICPDPEFNGKSFFDYLMLMRKDFKSNPVLIPTSDKFILPLNDYSEELSEHYYFTMPKEGLLRKLTSKRYSYELAVKYGFPAPRTCFVKDLEGLSDFINIVEFPCIIKPEFPESWRSGFLEEFCKGEKVIVVNTREEVFEKYEILKKYDDRVIIQEIIPGKDSNLNYFVSYLDKNQICKGSFTGIKERIAPVHFGSASYVNIKYNEELENNAINWLQKMKFWGISGVEVKKDDRDNVYKLIEVNPRFGLWDEVGTKFGIDVAMMSYRELLGEKLESVENKNTNIRWISIHRDIRASAEYISKGILKPGKIAESYLDFPLYIGDMRLNDTGLLFYLVKKLVRGLFKRIFRKKQKI